MTNLEKTWWFGFQDSINYKIENDVLTVYIYDPPEYSKREVEVELNPHTKFGHELSHLLAAAFYFKGFDPSGAYLWSEKITDSFDPGRALFYECWVIHGQVLADPEVDLNFKLEHHLKGRDFLIETYPIIKNIPTPEKWIKRWGELKDKFDALTSFRQKLDIDPWWPKGFTKIKLAKIETLH